MWRSLQNSYIISPDLAIRDHDQGETLLDGDGYCRRVDFEFALMIYVMGVGPNESRKVTLVNYVMVMNFAEKLAEGSPTEVMANPEVKGAYPGSEEERC